MRCSMVVQLFKLLLWVWTFWSASVFLWNFHVGTPTVQRHECCISWWISVIWVWRIFCLSVLSLWCTGDWSRVYSLLPKSLLGCLYRQTETEPWPWAWSLFCSSLSLSFLLYLFLLNHFHSWGNSFLKAFKLPLWTPWAIVSVSWIWFYFCGLVMQASQSASPVFYNTSRQLCFLIWRSADCQ